ncbi:phosphotransferase [Deinococcus yunweiensis]|uniref:phosphotransferase n=1 Tax=Deinococcus yunweiensis TaxID=367282 RepID=UPI00398E5662
MTEDVSALIRAHLPGLAGLDITLLGEGTDHRVYEVGGWLLRLPRHREAGEALEVEARVLRWLAPQLPLPIPAYEVAGPELAGYRTLSGTPGIGLRVPLPTLGPRLGTFLRALHDMDVGRAAVLGVKPDDDPALSEWMATARDDLDVAAGQHLVDPDLHRIIRPYLLEPPPRSPLPPRLIHGDFAAEHVLLDGSGDPCGVIDWSDMIVGDVAQDLAGLLHWGGPGLLEAALRTYGPIDDSTRDRARFYATCRALGDLVFGEQTGRSAYVQAGQSALTMLFPDPPR